MIHRVFEFAARRVSDIMTPRDRIFMLDINTPPDEIFAQVIHGHFSRVPVYRGNPDNIVRRAECKGSGRPAPRSHPATHRSHHQAARCSFRPASRWERLFDEIRRERVWMALVVDEFGKLLGLVTLEDVLEELFGEIRDEFDLEGPELTKVGEREWLVSGGIDIKRLRDEFGDGFRKSRRRAHLEQPDPADPAAGAARRRIGKDRRLRRGRGTRARRDHRAGEVAPMIVSILSVALAVHRMHRGAGAVGRQRDRAGFGRRSQDAGRDRKRGPSRGGARQGFAKSRSICWRWC